MAITTLDSQFSGHNFLVKILPEDPVEVENIAKDVVNGVAERDIYTGDNVEVVHLNKDGIKRHTEAIRRD